MTYILTEEDHLRTLEIVLARLQNAGLKLKKDKCLFMASSVVYLGYLIDADGLHPIPDEVKVILEAPEPTNVRIESYLGLLNYYGSLLQESATWICICCLKETHDFVSVISSFQS